MSGDVRHPEQGEYPTPGPSLLVGRGEENPTPPPPSPHCGEGNTHEVVRQRLDALREQFLRSRGVAWLVAPAAPDGAGGLPAVRFAIVWKEEDKRELGAPAYTLAEVERLADASPAQVRAAHELKMRLGAAVLPADDPHARPPRRNQEFARPEPARPPEEAERAEPDAELEL